MNDFQTMARILAAVKACERRRRMDEALFAPEALDADEATRDSIIVKLQKAGYVEGFFIIDDVDNQKYPYIEWGHSKPQITIAGMTFIEENKPLRKAINALKAVGIEAAKAAINKGIMTL